MKKHDRNFVFSSKSMEWPTPRSLFEKLDKEHKFNLDPCAQSHNALCPKYFTPEDDGLIQDWQGHNAFVNPPYGRAVGHWVKKCYEETRKDNTTAVLLIPSRTDTRYWHDYVMKANEIHFIKGRVKFGGGAYAAPFPSAVIVFRGQQKSENSPKIFPMANK